MNCETSSIDGKRVGIIQSNYIPWKGYFDFIDSVDEFVLLDDVQYTRRDWRNRNLIKTKDGLRWLTIPVVTKGRYHAPIDSIELAGHDWIDEHLKSMKHAYGKAPYFRSEWPWISSIYEEVRGMKLLAEANEHFLRAICVRLSIHTRIRRSREFLTPGGKNERLLEICEALGAAEYLSGPAAKSYIDDAAWAAHGIAVTFKNYDGYPEYDQLHPPFEHGVSILDVIFHCGDDSGLRIKNNRDVEQ